MFRRLEISGLMLAVILGLTGCGRGAEENNTGSTLQNTGGPEPVLNQMGLLQSEDPDYENPADMLQINGAGAMVQLKAEGFLGSGVIYEAEDGVVTILTAAHVLDDVQTEVQITFCDGWSVMSDDFVCFEPVDAAAVRLEGSVIPREHLENYLCVNVDKESFDAVAAGDGCIVMGSSTGVAADAYEGTVLDSWIYMEDYEQYMMWVKAEGMPGMSGGGLFDMQGHFLGILSGKSEDGELAAAPLSLIMAQMQEGP